MSDVRQADYEALLGGGCGRPAAWLKASSLLRSRRYRDFQVREINRDGRVAQLDSLEPPAAPAAAAKAIDLSDDAIEALVQHMEGLAGADNAALFRTFLFHLRARLPPHAGTAAGGSSSAAGTTAAGGVADGAAAPSDACTAQTAAASVPLKLALRPVADKDARRAVHEFLKSDPRLPPLETDTVQVWRATGRQLVALCFSLNIFMSHGVACSSTHDTGFL